MRRFLVLPLALVIGIFVLAACSSADEAEVEPTQPTQAPVVQVQPTAPPAQQQPQPTQAPAVQPTQAPPQEPSAVLTASEVIQQAAGEMGVPLQLPQPPANYAPVKGGNVDLVTNGWPFPRYWDWLYQGAYSNMYISLWAETLVTFPQGPGTNPADYTPQPHLAESWSVSDDGLIWNFSLRKGVKYNDDQLDVDSSRDMIAQDWVDMASYAFDQDEETGKGRFTARFPEITGPESWKAIDDYTLEVTLNRPTASFLYKLAIRGPQLYGLEGFEAELESDPSLKPRDVMNNVDLQYGTGPWVMTGWTPDVSVTYEANGLYWKEDGRGNQLPFIDSVEMFVMKDERAQDAGFRTGKLGALALETCGMSTERYLDINKSNPDTVWEIFVDPTNQRAVYPNFSEGTPFHDINVRRAMQLSIDKVGWVNSVLGGWGLPFSTPLAPGNQFWLPPGQYGDFDGDGIPAERYLDYDVEGAKALMAESGYTADNGISGTFLLTNDLGNRFFSEGELVVESLRNIGIDLEIVVRDGSAFQESRESGDFTVSYGFPGYGWDPSDWLARGYHSRNTLNYQPVSGLVDGELDKMIDAEEAEVDPAKRYELVADVQRYLMEKQYFPMSTNWIQIVAIQPWLVNYQYQYSYPIGNNLALSWVER